MKGEWPHPNHRHWAKIATLLTLLSNMLAESGFAIGWFVDRTRTKYGLNAADDVKCYSGTAGPEGMGDVCLLSGSDEVGSGGTETNWPATVFAVVSASNSLDFFGIVLHVVFWLCNKKIELQYLKMSIPVLLLSAYTRFVACWIVVHVMPSINARFMQHRKSDAVMISTLPLGLLFLSVCFDILAAAAVKVVLDEGVKGEPTHKERLAAVEEENAIMHAQLEKKRSSFHTDTSEEHKMILDNASHTDTISETGSVTSQRSHRQSRNESIQSTASAIKPIEEEDA